MDTLSHAVDHILANAIVSPLLILAVPILIRRKATESDQGNCCPLIFYMIMKVVSEDSYQTANIFAVHIHSCIRYYLFFIHGCLDWTLSSLNMFRNIDPNRVSVKYGPKHCSKQGLSQIWSETLFQTGVSVKNPNRMANSVSILFAKQNAFGLQD